MARVILVVFLVVPGIVFGQIRFASASSPPQERIRPTVLETPNFLFQTESIVEIIERFHDVLASVSED